MNDKRRKELNDIYEEALREIKIETTEDIMGLTRDEALDVIICVRELAEEALKQEV